MFDFAEPELHVRSSVLGMLPRAFAITPRHVDPDHRAGIADLACREKCVEARAAPEVSAGNDAEPLHRDEAEVDCREPADNVKQDVQECL